MMDLENKIIFLQFWASEKIIWQQKIIYMKIQEAPYTSEEIREIIHLGGSILITFVWERMPRCFVCDKMRHIRAECNLLLVETNEEEEVEAKHLQRQLPKIKQQQ